MRVLSVAKVTEVVLIQALTLIYGGGVVCGQSC